MQNFKLCTGFLTCVSRLFRKRQQLAFRLNPIPFCALQVSLFGETEMNRVKEKKQMAVRKNYLNERKGELQTKQNPLHVVLFACFLNMLFENDSIYDEAKHKNHAADH